MKTTILLACLMSTSLMAKTTITIPLHVEIKNKLVTTAEINKKYKLTGLNKLAETIVASSDKASIDAAHESFWNANAQVDELAEKLGADFYLAMLAPQGCYTGKASEAVDIVGSLSDGPFSDQLGFWGWKYKNETHYQQDYGNEETNETLNNESKLWKNWKGLDESILIVFHVTDDGDDVNDSIITKCK